MESVCQPLICISGRTKACKSPKLLLVILRVNTVVTILSWMPVYYTIPASLCGQQNEKGNKNSCLLSSLLLMNHSSQISGIFLPSPQTKYRFYFLESHLFSQSQQIVFS